MTEESSIYCTGCSPDWSIDRTFTITLKLIDSKNKYKIFPKKIYRNPIIVTQEMQKLLDEEIYSSKAELARNLGISRARVTQMLKLHKLDQGLMDYILTLGDTWSSPIVTERKLRSIINQPCEQQKLKNIFNQNK